MKKKKLVGVAGAATVEIAAAIWIHNREAPVSAAAIGGTVDPSAPPVFHVNPEASTAAMTTKAIPQLSNKRYEPSPTGVTGRFADPDQSPPVAPESVKKPAR